MVTQEQKTKARTNFLLIAITFGWICFCLGLITAFVVFPLQTLGVVALTIFGFLCYFGAVAYFVPAETPETKPMRVGGSYNCVSCGRTHPPGPCENFKTNPRWREW